MFRICAPTCRGVSMLLRILVGTGMGMYSCISALPVDIRSLPHLRPRCRSLRRRRGASIRTCVLFRTDAPAAIAQSWLPHALDLFHLRPGGNRMRA